jgi:hypothetical protein
MIMQSWDETMMSILSHRSCNYPFPVDERDMCELQRDNKTANFAVNYGTVGKLVNEDIG